MNRYRVVTRTTNEAGSETHVSSVVQSLDEAVSDIVLEGAIARHVGWIVSLIPAGLVDSLPSVVCLRGETLRSLSIRVSTPWDDSLPDQAGRERREHEHGFGRTGVRDDLDAPFT